MNPDSEGTEGLSLKPSVLHLVGGQSSQGGMLSYVRQLARRELPGFDQRVWKSKGYDPENEKFVCLGRAKTLDTGIFTDLRGAALDFRPLCQWLRKNPNTVLYAHNRANAILAALIHLLYGFPVLIQVHNLGRKKLLNRLVWRLARATVIFNSNLSCRHFGRSVGNSHIHTPTIRWPEQPEPGEGRLVACSAIQPFKNIHLIIEAFNAAGSHAPRSLHIYGLSTNPLDPPYQQHIVEMAKQNPRVFLHYWDEHWTEHLGYADIFIHARQLEPFGIVMLEAFAKGCRMIVPRDTFLEDLTHDGVFFADLTVESLAMNLDRAMASSPSLSLWKSRRAFAKQFSAEEACQRLQVVLRSILRGNPRFKGVTEPAQINP